MAVRTCPVVPVAVEALDPVVVVEVVGKNIVRAAVAAATVVGVGRHLGRTVGVAAAAAVVGVGRHLGPTIGVAADEVGRNPEPVVVVVVVAAR